MRTNIRKKKQSVVFACVAVLLAAGAWHAVRADGQDDDRLRKDLRVIGLTDDGKLVSFRARWPERTRDISISGLRTDTAIVGIILAQTVLYGGVTAARLRSSGPPEAVLSTR